LQNDGNIATILAYFEQKVNRYGKFTEKPIFVQKIDVMKARKN